MDEPRSWTAFASLGSRGTAQRPCVTARVATERGAEPQEEFRTAFITASGLPDYYEVLGVDDDASPQVIKVAYRTLAKSCHPDFLGAQGHNICILLNEAYSVLSNAQSRATYDLQLEQALRDDDDTFTGKPLSKWLVGTDMSRAEDAHETRAVFVDEIACIGCKQCIFIAPATFRIEGEHGRSRVFAQWADNEDDTQAAIDSCPVTCIYWVQKEELAALEWVMQVHMQQRTNVGMMMCGQGGSQDDVWDATATYMKKRNARMKQRELDQKYSKAQTAARRQAAEDLQRKQESGPWWARVGNAFNISNLGSMARGYVTSDPGERKVGRRKRARPVAAAGDQLSDGTGTIPVERSLVSIDATIDFDDM